MRSSVLVRADVSGRCMAAGAGVSDLLDLVVVLIPLSPDGGGYLQGTPMLKLARVLSRY